MSFIARPVQTHLIKTGRLRSRCLIDTVTPQDQSRDSEELEFQPNIVELVREGYRNVIVQDPILEGASADVIRERHIQWVKERGSILGRSTPRFDYCLVLDARSIRSILASMEPGKPGMVGYVNVIDCDFQYDPNDPENECSEHYDGSVRVCLNSLFQIALSCEDLRTGEQAWGDWGMERPGRVIYTDGHCSTVEEEEVFLCPSDYNLYFVHTILTGRGKKISPSLCIGRISNPSPRTVKLISLSSMWYLPCGLEYPSKRGKIQEFYPIPRNKRSSLTEFLSLKV